SIGGKILSDHNNNKYLHMAQVIALTHHERWDGSGYLQGLQNREIPLSGRIVGLCDVFDALVSDRPYKEAWLIEDAIAEIESRSGTHFDPYLVELFHKIIDEILEIRDRFCDSSSSLKYIS
ncbi:MAG: HD domain-containing phosphohydrolase, partial [Spirochaetota bacterium]|nr:HD domain-containing phosphohydrolase [Spirochaetota bacterium]